MNTKQLLIVAATAWAATNMSAETSQERMNAFKNFKMLVSQPTNIFENQEAMDNFYPAKNSVDKQIESALKDNKSDTLKNIHRKMSTAVLRIHDLLDQFSVHFESMKNDAAILANFRTSVKGFSKERDLLKNEIAAVQVFKRQNQKERSGEAMQAKQKTADMLIDYAQTFITVAQKAITDFANIDAALFNEIQEENKRRLQEEKRTAASTRDSGTWSDWDSSNE